jgi:copper chaperone CopZ
MQKTISIEGMHCEACVEKVTKALQSVRGVSDVHVSLPNKQAEMTINDKVTDQQLATAVEKTGYKVVEKSPSALSEKLRTYRPIIAIFLSLILLVIFLQMRQGYFDLMSAMRVFMGGFFLIFGAFKLVNIPGFAQTYASYDVIAKKIPQYGYVYPFIELGLGVAHLTGYKPFETNVTTLVVMGISSVGVIQALAAKRTIQCACLGTFFKLPMSSVTLFEDLLMVAMSIVMLFIM